MKPVWRESSNADAAVPGARRYRLRLFVTGLTSRSTRAVANLRSICEERLAGMYELEVIESLGFCPYFLVVRDIVHFAHSRDIPIMAIPLARFGLSFAEGKGEFIGREALTAQWEAAARVLRQDFTDLAALPRRIVPLAVTGRGIARAHSRVLRDGHEVGAVTSGTAVPYWIFDGDDETAVELERLGFWTATSTLELGEILATGHDLGYRQCGTLLVARDRDDREALDDLFAFQQQLGLAVRRLRSRDARQLEPALAPGTRGGVFVEDDHQVDNRALVGALHVACQRAGVSLVEAGARALRRDDDRVTGVTLDDGTAVPLRRVRLVLAAAGVPSPATFAVARGDIAEAAERTPDGTWIRAVGMNPEQFPDGRLPTRWDIDEATRVRARPWVRVGHRAL